MVHLSRQTDKTGLWIILAVGLTLNILGFFIGLFLWGWALLIGNIVGTFVVGIIGLFLGRKEQKSEFWCGLCHIKYREEFLGGVTAHEGKLCRTCLGKRQRGENISSPPSSPPNQNYQPQPKEEVYYKHFQPERGFDTGKSREKEILLRELGRKQRKRNGYLTQFIINLAVLQWLLPLLTILFFWITMKEQMKVEALKSGVGLATEIPFSQVLKDFFKILTSEFYTYGGHNISINLIWKLGIILVFLLPLGFWIYNLVRFLGANGEVKQLETEIKELDR